MTVSKPILNLKDYINFSKERIMDIENKTYKNLFIMITPIILPAIFFLIKLGESFLLFGIPLIISLFITILLANRLSTKDAIYYPFVQYSFLFLLFYLFTTIGTNFGFILILLATFIINMSIGTIYFFFAKKKRLFTKILILIITLFFTIIIYSDKNGKSVFEIIIEKLL